MATFAGGMFGRMRTVLGLDPAPPPTPAERARQQAEQAQQQAARELTGLQQDLLRRRARYLKERQAAQAEWAAQQQAAREAEQARQARAREEILEIIARSDHGCYFPGDHLIRRRSWVGRVVDLFRSGG